MEMRQALTEPCFAGVNNVAAIHSVQTQQGRYLRIQLWLKMLASIEQRMDSAKSSQGCANQVPNGKSDNDQLQRIIITLGIHRQINSLVVFLSFYFLFQNVLLS